MADLDLLNFQGFLDYEGLEYYDGKSKASMDAKVSTETIRAKKAESDLDTKKIDKTTVATSSTLGLVKSGTDITVDSSGNVSVNDDSHNHVISNVDGLQSTLDAKAPIASPTLTGTPKAPTASAGTNTTQIATTAFVQTAIGNLINSAPESANTLKELSDLIEEHQDVTDALNEAIGKKAASSDLTSHTGNTTVHITSTERTNWNDANSKKHSHSNKTVLDNTTASYTTAEQTKLSGIATGAEVNQNAFSNVTVGSTTISADSKTDTLTLVAGSNVTITPDATNDKVTIAATNTTYSAATQSAQGLMSAADKKKLDGIASGANAITVDSALSSTSTNPVQNKVINSALAGKANSSHGNHVPATETANNAKFLRNDNTWQTVTPANIGAATSGHTHTTLPYSSSVTTSDAVDGFLEANALKSVIWQNTSGVGVSNGIILSGGYTNTNYGFQIAIDDDPTYFMALRQKGTDGWKAWKKIPMGDGTNASGTWGIGISGNAATATTATKLGTDAGSATQPVYFSGGKPVATTYTLGASVPSGAKFTDTVYTHPTSSGNKHIPSGGSSGQILRWSADGTAVWGNDSNTTYGVVSTTADGLAPKRDGSTTKFLRADGTWATPPDTNTTYSQATSSALGLVKIGYSASGKNYAVQLDSNGKMYVNVPWTDNNTTYSNMTGATSSADGKAGLVPAPASGKQTSFLRGDGTWVVPTNTTYSNMTAATSSAAGKAGLVPAPTAGAQAKFLRGDGTWQTPTNTTYSAATTSSAGLMSAADKTKLDSIATGANKYSLPTASSSTLGGVKTTSTVTSTSGLTACPIISGVPYYKDTNTTYSAATTSANGLMTSAMVTKLNGIATGATKNSVTTSLASTSTTNALAASAGKSLQDQITALNSDLADITYSKIWTETVTTDNRGAFNIGVKFRDAAPSSKDSYLLIAKPLETSANIVTTSNSSNSICYCTYRDYDNQPIANTTVSFVFIIFIKK